MGGIVIGLGALVALIAYIVEHSKKQDGQGGNRALPPAVPPDLRAGAVPATAPGAVRIGKSLDENSPKPYAQGLPEGVKRVVLKQAKGLRPTKVELELAASSASVAGYPQLSDALTEKAKTAPQDGPVKGIPSPFPEVSHAAWTAFVKSMGGAKADAIGPRGSVGIFQIPVRRMVDLGLMNNPRKGANGWTADWAVPSDRFLKDPRLQYKVFEKSMTAYRNGILSQYKSAISKMIEDRPASLSGLMAVAHHTGIDGLGKWLDNQPPRSKFKATTNAYLTSNGIF